MLVLNTRLACSLCGVESTVGEIGDHLAQVHIGPGDSDWHCSNGCLYRTSSKAEMASHCLITRHPAAELTRPLTFPQMLAAVQSQFCPVVKDFPAVFGTRTDEIFDDKSHSDKHGDIEERETELLDQKCASIESDVLIINFPLQRSVENAVQIVENSEGVELELDDPRSPKPFNEKNIPAATKFSRSNKAFQCDYCELLFWRKAHLERHVEGHTAVQEGISRPSLYRNLAYKCDNCAHSFRRKDKLERHSRIHTGNRPFQCPLCHYTAVTNYKLKSHHLTHTGEKPFSCPTCRYTFAHKGNLTVHQRTHHPTRRC